MGGGGGLPAAALRGFLDNRFGRATEFALARVAGGQSNPTYFVTHGRARLVLRTQPAGPILPGAHAIDREFRVLSCLHPAGLPVPRPILYHAGPELLGTPFYLMERVEGRVFADAALPGLPRGERRAMWMAVADAMAALHTVRPEAVGLGDFGRPGNYFARQIGRWTGQWRASAMGPVAEIDRLAEWLPANLPPDDGATAIAHGDFRIGNMLFHPVEPRVVAILDWELATLGHPLADLGFACIAWHSAGDEYGGLLGRDLAAEGLPEEADFVARYMARCPASGPLRDVHRVFALFRFAVIFAGIADRAAQGSAAGEDAARLAPLARRFAVRACEIIDGTGHAAARGGGGRGAHA